MNPSVRAAPADVAVHRIVNLGIGGLRGPSQQGRGLHNLSALTIATLSDIVLFPGNLARVRASAAEAFNSGDFLARYRF